MMRISFKNATYLILVIYILPLLVVGFFVSQRLEERQVLLTKFLQNQANVDKEIASTRTLLFRINNQVRGTALNNAAGKSTAVSLEAVKADIKKFQDFVTKYQERYSANSRPLLLEVLEDSQEMNLVEEETRILESLSSDSAKYFASALDYYTQFKIGEVNYNLLIESNGLVGDVLEDFNKLSEVRYIFEQRLILAMSGENERQYGFFMAIFVIMFASIIVLNIFQFFFIYKPFGDIMMFLKDAKEGKKGQRLYFSSRIKDIKESEEAINKFVGEAEEFEKKK